MKRNRVKRWLREAFRHHKHELAGCWDMAFIASPRASTADYHLLEQEVVGLLAQLSERAR